MRAGKGWSGRANPTMTGEHMKKNSAVIAIGFLCGWVMSASAQQAPTLQQAPAIQPNAPVVGVSPFGVTVTTMNTVVLGWSAKKAVLGKAVLNDMRQKIGTIDDIIITPDNSVSFAIISTGGFLGLGKHDVAIPMNQIRSVNNDFILPGATKDALKVLPAFEYQKAK
jgi:sporulation protein YlmC with PRC-barrel domain